MTVATGLRVIRSAPRLLIEDLGRPGWAHLGVPPSGALDPVALALANRLVGNPESAAGLEVLLGGCSFVAEESLRLAVTGAALPLLVDGRLRAWGEPVSVRRGERVDLGTSSVGLRAWLAVAGGLDVPPVLGSRSTDTLTGLGPKPVRDGDLLVVGAARASLGHGSAVPEAGARGPRRLQCSLGPRADWFSDDALAVFSTQVYTVASDSDRIGIRLEAPGAALERRSDEELASEGVVTGAVQVPASGRPLVFLADHPVTGGYPVIAVVDPADLRWCAQLRPGDEVSFAPVSSVAG